MAHPGHSARLLFAGSVALGGERARLARADPDGPFADVRFTVASADLAVADLRWAFASDTASAADPGARVTADEGASLLAHAGFDAMAMASDDAGDGTSGALREAADALDSAGLLVIGSGEDATGAFAPRLMDVKGIRLAFLAFDATGGSQHAATEQRVASWDPERGAAAVVAARNLADVVAVAVQRGPEDAAMTFEDLSDIASPLASAGADVVWLRGSATAGPALVIDPDGDGRHTVVAMGLGEFLSDGAPSDASDASGGSVLEVLAGTEGILAYRVGAVEQVGLRPQLRDWLPPSGDAVAIDDSWWSVVAHLTLRARPRPRLPASFAGEVAAVTRGDLTGDGRSEVVVAFRRPFRPTPANSIAPRSAWTDTSGMSAHVGLYRPRDMREIWVAGTLVLPVVRLAACDGVLAVAYTTLDDPAIVATGAWRWQGFGFVAPLADLDGSGTPTCVDLDRDGRLEAAILERSPR